MVLLFQTILLLCTTCLNIIRFTKIKTLRKSKRKGSFSSGRHSSIVERFVNTTMTIINHSIKISQNSLVGFISNSVKNIIKISLMIYNSWFFFCSFQIEGKKGTSRSILNSVLLKFMIAETDLRIFIKKCNFASDNLHKTNLISYLSDRKS